VRPTRVSTLLWVALAAVPIGWSVGRVIDTVSGTLPPIPWILPLLLVFFAILLFVGAYAVRGWVEERRYDRRLDALRIARLLALGKAAAVFGAFVVGAYLGIGVLALGSLAVPAGRNRTVLAALVIVAGVVIVVAALRLERACLVPPDEDTSDTDGARPA
jgi:4-hydroxybenzoate polyprenyltransferase